MPSKYGYELNPFWDMPGSVLIEGVRLGYRRKGIYPVEAVLSKIGPCKEVFHGDSIHMGSMRYKVFSQSLTCVTCGLTGSYFAKEQTYRAKVLSEWHFNLYAIALNPWREVLMTKDHILPRSLGGSDLIENLQTMCHVCNNRKGNGDGQNGNASNPQKPKDGVPSKTGWLACSPEISGESIRLFKREFTRVFLERLGWDPGDHAGREERISYDR